MQIYSYKCICLYTYIYLLGFIYWKDAGSISGLRRSPWREKWQPTPAFLLAKSHRQKSMASYSPWSRRVRHNLVTKQQHLYITFFWFLFAT